MIKKTLYFGNPAYLSLHLRQLVIKLPEVEKADDLAPSFKKEATRTIPIEDIGVMVLDHPQIVLTQALISELMGNNVALISCDAKHLPLGLLLPLHGNTTHSEHFRQQLDASLPLKKQLWQQTMKAKIWNQATVLDTVTAERNDNMRQWARKVRSGDPENLEARAAVWYWKNLFPDLSDFVRDREGDNPNALLNYGYAILRAVVARGLVAAGLLPVSGIHHHNRYNAYCLADDIMEPYRPAVDLLIVRLRKKMVITDELTKEMKKEMLMIPVLDVWMSGQKRPLMVAVSETCASLARCFSGESTQISYPEIIVPKDE